jgi:hypothetical protein
MELFNVVLGRKKDLGKCRGKLTIERHRDLSSLCTCSIPLLILSHVRNSNFVIWPHFPQTRYSSPRLFSFHGHRCVGKLELPADIQI